jgi:hypothetical protein
MQPWRTKPPERGPKAERQRLNDKARSKAGLFVDLRWRIERAASGATVSGSAQGMAVMGRNSKTTLVTSVQKLLDRMKRRKFSMRCLPLSANLGDVQRAITFRPFAFLRS